MGRLDSFGDSLEGQGFCSSNSDGCGEHFGRQCPWPPTGMPTHQSRNAQRLPVVSPVVERLVADPQNSRNRLGMFLGAQHQHPRRPRASISPRVVDRHLHQGLGFAFRQCQFYFHRRLPGVGFGTTQKHFSNQFRLITYIDIQWQKF